MPLPYCPNCRYPIEEPKLGWICRRTYRPANPFPNSQTSGTSAQQGMAAFGQQPAASQAYVQMEDILCLHPNPAGQDTCLNAACGEPRANGLFLPSCHHCEMEIPNLPNISARTLTIAGPSGAGKTHYIVALYEWWQRRLGDFGLAALEAMGERIQDSFFGLREQVMGLRKPADATVKGTMISYTWLIMPPIHANAENLLISFPDASGEHMLTANGLARNRHFHHTSGVIFLLDGDRIAMGYGSTTSQASAARGNPMDHLTAAKAMLTDMMNRLSRDELVNMPIAICVNKIDRLSRENQAWNDLVADYVPRHQGGFDWNTCSSRSQQIEALLLAHPHAAGVAQLLRANFANIMFFSLATIGSDGKDSHGLRWNPKCVEDPFLWLLSLQHYVPSI